MTDEPTDWLDEELSRRFAHLRAAEGRMAPPFPAAQPAPAPGPARLSALGIAAGLAAAVLVAVVLVPPAKGPDTLYREVIAASPLLGEGLLEVTPDVLPETTDVPQFLDGQLAAEASWEWLN
jgi:hypothetical protein